MYRIKPDCERLVFAIVFHLKFYLTTFDDRFFLSGAPVITKKLENVKVKENSEIKLTTAIEGSPTPDVKW